MLAGHPLRRLWHPSLDEEAILLGNNNHATVWHMSSGVHHYHHHGPTMPREYEAGREEVEERPP
jgi:hypothetical protein